MIANGAFHSKLVYLITLWGISQQYLLNALQVQQSTAARTVCGAQSWRWSRSRLLKRVGWMSIRQLIEYHTILQAHKTLTTERPRVLYHNLTSSYPYRTRSATSGHIRLRDTTTSTFQHRAMVSYNRLPGDIREGTLQTVKKNVRNWVLKNIPLD